MSKDSVPTIMIVAGEASSALYAQRLLEYWRNQNLQVKAFGVGSQAMVNLGFEALGRSEEMAVVGLQEVLSHFSLIKDVFYRLIDEAQKRKPDVILLLDYPDFNLRLCKRLKKLGLPVVYYISPQLWAWRTGRVEIIRNFIDRMLVVFPFEKDFYLKHQVKVDFVGHPLLDELKNFRWDEPTRQMHRKRFGIQPNDILIGMMPGSRRSELKHNLQTQLEAIDHLAQKMPQAKFAWLVAPTFSLDEAKAMLRPEQQASVQIIQMEPFAMIQLCDGILCASGTATLMVGLAEVPMVIMYRMNAITAFFAKRLVKHTPFFGMVNLIAGKKIVPELFQEQASPQKLADTMTEILAKEAAPTVRADLAKIQHLLGSHGATERVAKVLQDYLQRS